MRLFSRFKALAAALSLLIGVISAILFYGALGERVELHFHDMWYLIRGKRPPPGEIVIVAMDEMSYRNLGIPLNQPWPRKLHAKLLDRLAEYGAKKVVFDVLFLDASADAEADRALAASIAKLPVVLGVESTIQQVGAAGGSYALEEILEPYLPFRKAAKQRGLVGLPDDGAYIRRFFTQRTERTEGIPSLGEAGAGIDYQHDPAPDSDDLVNYYGPARSVRTVSYYQALEEELPLDRSVFEGKTVFVGLSLRTDVGPAQKDVFKNPYRGGSIFGVEVHATAAGNLLDRSWIRRLPFMAETVLTGFAATLLSLAIFSMTPTAALVFLAGWMLLWCGAAYAGFVLNIFVPGAFLSFIALPVAFLLATFRSFMAARRSEIRLRSAFEMYVSPDMVAQLQENEAGVTLGGQKVWATALFTDIEHFTDITEVLPPEKVAEMLNEYFTEVMDVVFRNEGTLIKFIGDAVFVIWGAPVHMDNHAGRAVATAQEIQQRVSQFNALKRYPELKTRVGINTGPMVVGNLGSKRRFDYTAIGDSVNLASRIEGLNKHFGTTLLFTDAVRKDSGISEGLVSVGDIRVKGKKESVALFTILSPSPAAEIPGLIEQGLRAFRKAQWEDAKDRFNEVASREPRLSGLAAFYGQYISRVSTEGNLIDWEGEIQLDAK